MIASWLRHERQGCSCSVKKACLGLGACRWLLHEPSKFWVEGDQYPSLLSKLRQLHPGRGSSGTAKLREVLVCLDFEFVGKAYTFTKARKKTFQEKSVLA